MAKADMLSRLIRTLTKAEKRYFRLYTSLQQGDKDYLHLFDAIDRGEKVVSSEATRYLYKVILDFLVHLRLQREPHIAGLLKGMVLQERSLHEDALRQLRRVTSPDIVSLWSKIIEMQVLDALNIPQPLPEIFSALKLLEHQQRHAALYAQLRHHFLYRGPVRTLADRSTLDALFAAAAAVPVGPQQRLLFQAYYYLLIGDYSLALESCFSLENLDYEGVLYALRAARRYAELGSVLSKVSDPRLWFLYAPAVYLDSGDFANALRIQQLYFSSVDKNPEVFFFRAVAYLGVGDINNAHFSLEQVLQQSSLYSSLPIYRTFRLLHLLVQYELGNYEYIRYETRAFRRHLRPDDKNSFLLERTVVKFLSMGEISSAQKPALWKKLSVVFERIRLDPYERHQLLLFDFSAWVEGKLLRKGLSVVLAERFGSFFP